MKLRSQFLRQKFKKSITCRYLCVTKQKKLIMKQLTLFISILFSCCIQHTILAQSVTFSFPALPEKEVQSYFFHGAKLDSLAVYLDKEGNGTSLFPENYTGFVQTVVNRASLVGFIVGENQLIVQSDDLLPSKDNVKFPGSEENAFYNAISTRQQKNLQQKGWLDAGIDLFSGNKNMEKILQKEIKENKKENEKIEKETSASRLYAARFTEITYFVENLYQAENRQDTAKIRFVKDFVQNKMDWEALYTSGQFWSMVHNYYLSVFNKEDINRPLEETQLLYANSLLPAIEKTDDPVRSALFTSIMNECESFGWGSAKNLIISHVINNNISLDFTNTSIARILQGYEARAGEVAPPVSGIDNLNNSLLVFYEAGCGGCQIEIKKIIENYNTILEKGTRIISISSDLNETLYKSYTENFPWTDKLCDFRGFEGPEFTAYGIHGTPTLFLIDNQGKIVGRYHKLQDTKLLD